MKPPRMLNDKKSSPSQAAIAVIMLLLTALLLFDLYYVEAFFVVEVSGGSMENTLFDGDIVLAERRREAERGDIVILDVSAYSDFGFRGNFIIKRVIATEGDTLKCVRRALFLRKAGEREFFALDEPYVDFQTNDFDEVTIGKGEIFVMGDHRNNSMDSRDVGPFLLSEVVGVVPTWAVEHKDFIGGLHRVREIFSFH